jgi:uncharacterized membrane protein
MSEPRFSERVWDATTGLFPWAMAIVVIAGITHLASILMMPRLAPRDAYARMTALSPLHRTTLLPRVDSVGEGESLDDPALARAVCRYDLTRGPVRLRANLTPDALMLLSFNARRGDIYYSMTDRSATRGRLEALIFTQDQLDDVEANDSEDELPQELRIVAPTSLGFVLMRALAERPGDMDDAEKRVMSIACGLDKEMKN